MASNCTYFDACPICGSSERVKLLWILAYCKTQRHEECARFTTRQSGEMPAFALLPDGSMMSTAEEQVVRAYVEELKQAGAN